MTAPMVYYGDGDGDRDTHRAYNDGDSDSDMRRTNRAVSSQSDTRGSQEGLRYKRDKPCSAGNSPPPPPMKRRSGTETRTARRYAIKRKAPAARPVRSVRHKRTTMQDAGMRGDELLASLTPVLTTVGAWQ